MNLRLTGLVINTLVPLSVSLVFLFVDSLTCVYTDS